MEHYSRLDEKEVRAICEQFDISNIDSFGLLSGGSENTNYLIVSNSRKYVLCIFEQKTAQDARKLSSLLKHLATNNFHTTQLINTPFGEPVILWNDKPVMVKTFLEGEIIKNLSPRLMQLIGKNLAKLHQIEPPDYLPKQISYGYEQFESVKEYAANSEFAIWLSSIREIVSPYLALNLPKSLIHSDVFWDNVIISEKGSSATIIDFEEAANYYRIFDIGMTIIGTCNEAEIINFEKVRQLLKGYLSEVHLLEDEIKSLKAFTIYAGAAMTFWRHQNFNFVKPNKKMADHYLGLKVLVDFIMNQPDDCFIELIENSVKH